MSVTIQTKDLGDIRDKFRRELEFSWKLEEGNEKYIKLNLGIRE